MSEPTGHPRNPAHASSDGHAFEISGGHPALDLANTVSRRSDPGDNREHLVDYGRLVTWSRQAGLLTAREADRLREVGEERPRAAVAALRRAVAAREAIFSIFSAISRGDRPPSAALDTLNGALPSAFGALRVAPDQGGFGWRFEHAPDDLAPMLAPILRSAAELLTSDDRDRVRECGSDTCFWLFLDRSKNGTRRWCDMKVCGNRAKARRHYQREKKARRGQR
ncbi:MAG TPA: ABATE domain-containing protein [Candidatus Polarisedimenticolaceae bacterium]|nr:ABATE domain-containing protein [Candidatus Polarisedimenticolaceae bacterium]